jgi:hypothetical protein
MLLPLPPLLLLPQQLLLSHDDENTGCHTQLSS